MAIRRQMKIHFCQREQLNHRKTKLTVRAKCINRRNSLSSQIFTVAKIQEIKDLSDYVHDNFDSSTGTLILK